MQGRAESSCACLRLLICADWLEQDQCPRYISSTKRTISIAIKIMMIHSSRIEPTDYSREKSIAERLLLDQCGKTFQQFLILGQQDLIDMFMLGRR